MALKEQANKKKSPRNKNNKLKDGKPLGSHIKHNELPFNDPEGE